MNRNQLHTFLIGFFSCLSFLSTAQKTTEFSFEEYMNIVKSNHPVAIQADLAIEKGRAYLLKARGGFDPKIGGNASQKYFDDKTYYSYINGGLKIPTWFGVALEAGYETNEGIYLNPENTVPIEGLWQAGISVPLGKGLFIDQRRAELKTAKLYAASTEFQRTIILNDLLFESSKVYWEWFKTFHKTRIYEEAVTNARIRFEGVKQEAQLGNRPYIDTLESLIVLQDRDINFQEASLEFKNATQLLEIFLWQDGIIPLELDSLLTPPAMDTTLLIVPNQAYLLSLDSFQNIHPELQAYQYKIDIEKINLRMKRENLKPQIDLKYNALSENVTGQNPFDTYNINNYKWGAEVSFPLFLRKERGDLKLSQIELRDMEAGIADKSQMITYKINASYNSWETTYSLGILLNDNQRNYQRLLDAEIRLFDIGESSIFMINSREKNYIYSQISFVTSIAENQKASVKLKYQLGILGD